MVIGMGSGGPGSGTWAVLGEFCYCRYVAGLLALVVALLVRVTVLTAAQETLHKV